MKLVDREVVLVSTLGYDWNHVVQMFKRLGGSKLIIIHGIPNQYVEAAIKKIREKFGDILTVEFHEVASRTKLATS